MNRKKMYMLILTLSIWGVSAVLHASSEASSEPIKIVFSTYCPTAYEYIWLPIKNFAEKVEKQSGGRIKFKLFHSKQRYTGKEEFAALERGDIDMSAPTDIYHTNVIPELGVSNLPFMWSNLASFQKTLDAGLWNQGIHKKLLAHNIVALGAAAGGPIQLYSKEFQVLGPGDIKGKKWGVSGNISSKAIAIMGGIPKKMSSGKLYMALQRGRIDGCTRPLLTGQGRKLYEVVDHLTITNMAYFCNFLAINKNKWDSLPEDIREIIRNAAKAHDQERFHRVQEFIAKGIQSFTEKGVKTHISTPEELSRFRDAMRPVYEWWMNEAPDRKKYIEFIKAHQ